MSNPDFGKTRSGITYDPDTLAGWGKRDHNWQFTTSLQREILARLHYGRTIQTAYQAWKENRLSDARALLAGTRPEIWSMGHRNVEGITFDTRGNLWASEFGEKGADELNRIVPGANYGWPRVEGRQSEHLPADLEDRDPGAEREVLDRAPVPEAAPAELRRRHGRITVTPPGAPSSPCRPPARRRSATSGST